MNTRMTIAISSIALLVLLTAGSAAAEPANVDTNDAYWWWGDPAGISRIVRTDEGISGNISVHLGNESGSAAGLTVTMWLVVFNDPGECDDFCNDPDLFDPAVMPDVVYGGGHIVGASEKLTIGFHYKAGSNSGSIADIFGLPTNGGESYGLIDSRAAEVHYVLRFHGPVNTAAMPAQIQSYEGGCVDNAPFGFLPPTGSDDIYLGVGECQDVIFAVHEP